MTQPAPEHVAEILAAGTPADFALRYARPDTPLERRGRPVILVFYPADWSPVCGDQVALYNEILPYFMSTAPRSWGSR
jgi:peroxiredoxin